MNCSRIGCTNEALFYPVLVLTPDGEIFARAEIREVTVCESCKAQTKVEDLVNDAGWKTIVGAYLAVGHAEPRRELTTLEWKEV